MSTNRMMFIGALAGFCLAIVAQIVSDMHGIGDWDVSYLQISNQPLNPAYPYSTPYTIAGLIGEPLLIVSIIAFSFGFFGSWLENKQTISIVVFIVGLLYAMERIYWSYSAINFGNAIKQVEVLFDYSLLQRAGYLKGIGALLGGIIGGFGFSTAITIYFFSTNQLFGKIGGFIVIGSMLVGMPAKILFMDNISALLVFIFMGSMTIKNIGIALMGVGLLIQSLKPGSDCHCG